MKFLVMYLCACMPFFVSANIMSTTALVSTTEDSTTDLQTLINDFKKIPNLLSQITIFGYEEDNSTAKTVFVDFAGALAAANQIISIINNGVTIGGKLFGNKPVPTANPMIAELETTTAEICAKLESIKESINQGIDKIIERSIQQQFEDQVLNKMAQLEIVAQYYLNGFDKGDEVALAAQCVENPPAAVMGALKALLPRMINIIDAGATNVTDDTPEFKTLLNIVVGVIREFILVYPACVKLLQDNGKTGFGDLNENAIITIKEVMNMMSLGLKQLFETVISEGGSLVSIATALRNRLKEKYPTKYFGVMLVDANNVMQEEKTKGNVFSHVYMGLKGLIAYSDVKPTSTECVIPSFGECSNRTVETVVELFDEHCPQTENYVFAFGSIGNSLEVTEYYKTIGDSFNCTEDNKNVQALYSFNGVLNE